METLNEGEALNKIKKGLKGAAIGAGVLGATAAGITGYGAVNGVRQAKAEKAAQERQAEEERAAKDKFANDLSQKLHKKGVDIKDAINPEQHLFDTNTNVYERVEKNDIKKAAKKAAKKAVDKAKELGSKAKDKIVKEEVNYFPY